jgi:hypothetical protein
MADRYWVGGAGTWSSSNTTNWSATSGGAGGASVPTSADTPIFDSNSGTGVVTFTNGGVTVGATTINNSGIELSLGAAFTTSGALTLTAGTFTTNDYNVTAGSLSSSNSNTRTINLGSSTVTLSGFLTAVDFTTSTNLTFNAGTSQINLNNSNTRLFGGSQVFYNVSSTASTPINQITGANTFNNFSVAGRTSAGVAPLSISADQTINGTLTLSAGTNATMRTFVQSNIIGTTRTLTCNAVASLQDIDFRDITIAGAAAPVSGTRLGDCKGNSGITFDAPKTVYWRGTGTSTWSGNAGNWSDADTGGSTGFQFFQLAQDTAIFQTNPSSGSTVTITAPYNIGTIDMSARTSNTMTLANSQQPVIYGNIVTGSGVTYSGTGRMIFAGRTTQQFTSAGRTYVGAMTIDSPSGSLVLQDALVMSTSSSSVLELNRGTFDANDYNVTLSGAGSAFSNSSPFTRTVAIGSGTWTIAGSGTTWSTSASNLTVTGTGTISLTSASNKTFAGGGISYSGITLDQGGAGTLTISGNNKFAGLTNTAIGRIQFTGGTTNEFTSFVINGVSGNLLQLGSTNTTAITLRKTGAWNVGANSTDAGNNTGLSFTAGDMDFLSISRVNGEVLVPTGTFNIFFGATNIEDIYYGSSAVSAIYYGGTLVFEK